MAKGHRSQIKKERNIATQEKRPHATAKYVGIPAPKAKIVLDQIKGKDVATAAAMLNYSPRLAAEIIGKVLKSAVANAENNLGMDVSKLYVEEVSADQGPKGEPSTALSHTFCHFHCLFYRNPLPNGAGLGKINRDMRNASETLN